MNLIKAVSVALVVFLLVTGALSAAGAESYGMPMLVVSVDYDADLVTVVDDNGDAWCFYGCEGLRALDLCLVVIDDHDTVDTFDDAIIECMKVCF